MQNPIVTPPWNTTPLWTCATLTMAVGSAYVATVLSRRLNKPNTYRLIRENNLDMYTLGTLWGLEPCLYIQTACWSGLRFVKYINEITNSESDTRWYHPTSVLKLSSAFFPALVHNVFRSIYSPSIMKFVTTEAHSRLILNAYQTVKKEINHEQIALSRVLNDIDAMPFPREITRIVCEYAAPKELHQSENEHWTKMYKSPSDNTRSRWSSFTDSMYFQKVLPVAVMSVMCTQFMYSMFASASVGWSEDGLVMDEVGDDAYDMLLGREMTSVEQIGVRALLVADVSGFVVCSYFLVKYHWDDLVRLVD